MCLYTPQKSKRSKTEWRIVRRRGSSSFACLLSYKVRKQTTRVQRLVYADVRVCALFLQVRRAMLSFDTQTARKGKQKRALTRLVMTTSLHSAVCHISQLFFFFTLLSRFTLTQKAKLLFSSPLPCPIFHSSFNPSFPFLLFILMPFFFILLLFFLDNPLFFWCVFFFFLLWLPKPHAHTQKTTTFTTSPHPMRCYTRRLWSSRKRIIVFFSGFSFFSCLPFFSFAVSWSRRLFDTRVIQGRVGGIKQKQKA